MSARRILVIVAVTAAASTGAAAAAVAWPTGSRPAQLTLSEVPRHAGGTISSPAGSANPAAEAPGASPVGTAAPTERPMRTWTVNLAGSLPRTGPGHGRIYRLSGGSTDGAVVARLARALGADGQPSHAIDGWHVSGPAARHGALSVRDTPGLPWSFGSEYASGPAAGDSDAQRALAAVLNATGTSGSSGPISRSGPYLTITTEPVVDGLPTASWSVQVTVGPAGAVSAAHGWLAKPRPSTSYPLITARAAFENLRRAFGHRPGPVEAAGQGCPQVEAEAARSCARTLTVTGATMGLSLVYDGDTPILAPSWIFSSTTGQPIPQIAIAPGYLSTPRP